MRLRVRFVTRQPNGSVAQKEQLVEMSGRRIRLGRGTDNDVFLKDLRVNYHHADIVVRDTDIVIEAVGDSPLRIDGATLGRGLLTPETEVEVGPYRVALQPGGGGADLGLEVELLTPPPTDSLDKLLAPGGLRLEGTRLGKRGLSWALFLLLMAAGLGLPLAAYLAKPGADPGRVQTDPATIPVLAKLDRMWNPGELAASHKFLINRCEACHEAAFTWVRSEACASCHADTEHHFETARFTFAGFNPGGCTDCHGEHQGPAGNVPVHQSLCADCHDDLSRHPPAEGTPPTPLLDAADFGTAHPEFRVAVVVEPGSGRIERATLGGEGFPAERSGLKFPHDIHLARVCERPPSNDPEVLAAWPEEKADACKVMQDAQARMQKPHLECADCHQPDPSGVDMRPVSMKAHCAACHTLQFDNAAPERVLPHGEPDEVIAVVQDYFAARASRGQQVVLKQDTGRRRAGQAAAQAAQAQAAQPRARDVSAQRLDIIFGRALCGYCHEVVPPGESPRQKWEVLPVRVTEHWMPKSIFSHAAHETSACTDCHKAEVSHTSEDVLMPPIKDCRTCHAGERTISLVPSTCTMCHVYHRDGLPPIMPRVGPATAAAG